MNYVEVQLANELWLSFLFGSLGLCILQVIQTKILYSSISPCRTIKFLESHGLGELHHCTTSLHTGQSEHMNPRLHTQHTQTHI